MFMCQSLLILNEFSLGAVLLFWPERLCLPETRQDCQIFANRLMAKHLNDWWPKNIYSMNHLLSLNWASKNFWESSGSSSISPLRDCRNYCKYLVVLSPGSDSYVLLPICQDPECTKIGSTWVSEQWVFNELGFISCDHALFWTCLIQLNAQWGIWIFLTQRLHACLKGHGNVESINGFGILQSRLIFG